jgi:hypothetical protein
MSKNVIFRTIFPIAPLSDPFSGYFDFPYVGLPKGYFHIKFGRNRLVNKNVRAPGVLKNRKFPLLGRSDPFFSTSHRRHRGRAADNLPINFGENRFVNKNFKFSGGCATPFSKIFTSDLKNIPQATLVLELVKVGRETAKLQHYIASSDTTPVSNYSIS